MKKLIPLSLVLFTSLGTCWSQSCIRMIDRLQSSRDGGRVTIHLDNKSSSTLSYRTSQSTVSGYRICIYNGSDQNARSRAASAASTLKNTYPNMSCNTIYDAPVWKVLCGTMFSRTEAAQVLSSLRSLFPSAFIVNDRISLAEFQASHSTPVGVDEQESNLE